MDEEQKIIAALNRLKKAHASAANRVKRVTLYLIVFSRPNIFSEMPSATSRVLRKVARIAREIRLAIVSRITMAARCEVCYGKIRHVGKPRRRDSKGSECVPCGIFHADRTIWMSLRDGVRPFVAAFAVRSLCPSTRAQCRVEVTSVRNLECCAHPWRQGGSRMVPERRV